MKVSLLLHVFYIIACLALHCQSFEFKAVDVLPDLHYVSSLTSYTINANRYSTQLLDFTPWDQQPVPAGSNVVVVFPAQYILTSPSCGSVAITIEGDLSLSASGFVCTVSGRQLRISNLFVSDTMVKSMVIKLDNIINPSLAITTDNFVVRIGDDTSADTPMASVIISPTQFIKVSATFDNTTVNSTSNLVITFTSANMIISGSNIVIEFPSILQWARDISPNRPLPLNSPLTCSGLTSNLKASISCVGSLAERSITLTDINTLDISINSTVSFKVGQLFSPPSTQEIDQIGIKVKSLYTDGFYYEMDSDRSKITGLTHRTMAVSFSSPSRVTVNSRIAIQMDIVLADTINQHDTMRVFFPSTSSFMFIDTRSTTIGFVINSTLSTYDPTNRILDIRQRSQAAVNFAGKSISIQMSSFTVPPSIKQFGIIFQFLRQNHLMAEGIVSTNALTTTYTGNVLASDLGVNRVGNYNLVLDVRDNHTGFMMIEIILPPTLKVDITTFSARTTISPTFIPTVTIAGTTQKTITLTNLISTSNTTILPQNITITLNNITNPSSVKNIGSFVVKTYYTSDLQEMVSQSTIMTTLVTVNGQIASSSVKIIPTQMINFKLTTYTIKFVIPNPVQVNGFFTIKLPSEVDLSQLTSVKLQTSSITSQLIQFSLINTTAMRLTNNVSQITQNSQVTFVLQNIRNPLSTRKTNSPQVQIQSFNSLSETIDMLNVNNSIYFQTTTANAMDSAKLERNSLRNDELTLWKFNLTQSQNIESGQKVIFVVDNAAIIPTTISCIDTVTTLSLTCTKLVSKPLILASFSAAKNQFSYISVTIPQSYVNGTTFLFTIQQIQNPPSYLPFTILLFTTSSDLTQFYSTVEQSYQNSQLSLIGIGSNGFSKRQLRQSSVLSFEYTVVSGFISLVVDFDANGFNLLSTSCTGTEWPDMACSVIGNTIKIFSSTLSSLSPKKAMITLSNIVTPATQNTAPIYIKLNSFGLSNQPMGSNTNSISYTLECEFPCKTCLTTNTSECSSCYRSPVSLKQYLGIDKKCYQQCPDGFNQNVDLYTCEKCSQPCMYCNNLKTNCTMCDATTQFIYLRYTAVSDTSTCLKNCPLRHFPDTNSVPVYCQPCNPPCLECQSVNFCLSCLQNNPSQTLYLHKGTCILTCPDDVTVQNTVDSTCIDCSSQCKTCSLVINNCTTCADTSIFFQGKCLTQCPLPLIVYNSTCVSCDSKCQKCSTTPTNCTSCNKTSNFSVFYSNECLTQCPVFYYSDINKICLECDELNIGCKNCRNQTLCNSCDSGYVLLVDKCLSTVPIGYINNSGVAVPCAGDCKTCQGTVSNCTSCKTLNLNGNLCQATCSIGETGVSQICTRCQYPCQTCTNQIFLCSSCYTNSSTFLYKSQCLTACPDRFYKNTLNMNCTACQSPCEKCVDEQNCITCLTGFFFYTNTSQCLAVCPSGMVGVNRVCVECQSPCSTCTSTTTACRSCVVGYFFSPSINECLTLCPSGTIKNEALRLCDSCTSPCQTCTNTTTQCLTCIRSQFLLQNQCYAQCPQYYFANSTTCSSCVLPCLTCTSQTLCTTCVGTLYQYRQGCVTNCPDEYGKIVDGICTQCDIGCFACQRSGACLQCSSGYISYLDQCITSCPTDFMPSRVNNTLTCVVKQQSDEKLQSSLLSTTSMSFPLPFTIFGFIMIGAGLMSKLQNSNTYLICLAYSIFGILETGVILYLLYSYTFQYQQYEMLTVYLILGGLGVFALLNFIGFIVHTCQLCTDSCLKKWVKSGCSTCTGFFITTFLSLIVNYKFKFIIFSRIFDFTVFKAQMTSVEKFKIFNFISFIGILGETELIFVLVRQFLSKKYFGNELNMIFIDALVVLSLNVVLSIASSWKSDDFFTEKIDGIPINKKVFIEGDLINKQPLKDDEQYHPYFSTRKTFNDSRQVLKNASNVINQFNDQQQVSNSQEKRTSKNSKNIKTQDKLYFEDQNLSSQTLRYKDDLQANPSKKGNLNNNKQSFFDKGIQEEDQADKNYNDQELRDEGLLISSNNEDMQNKSIKKSENIFCESPRKRQKLENPDLAERKGHYSEDQEDQNANRMRLNKQIQDSASHYNQVMKDKKLKQPSKQQSNLKRSYKTRKSRKDKEKNGSVLSNLNKINQIQNPSSKKLIVEKDGLESSHNSQYNEQQQQTPKYKFQQVSNSLKVSSDISITLQEEEKLADNQNSMNKIKINSQNSSKTYVLPNHLSPIKKESGIIDSESETVCQDGRLKPQNRQNSIKQLGPQNKIKINTMHYDGEQNSLIQEDAPKSRIKKPRYDKNSGQQIKYDKVEEEEKQEKVPNIQILIEKNQLTQSEQSYSMQEIDKNPLGYSPQSRIIQNKQDSRDFSQDEMLIQLHSHLKGEGSNLQQGKTLQLNNTRQQRLSTIEQAMARQTPYQAAEKQQSDPSNTKETYNNNNLKDKYQKIISKVQNMKSNTLNSKKRSLHLKGDQPTLKKHTDIYISPYLEDSEGPIKKRQHRVSKERKHPIQQRSKEKIMKKNDFSGQEGNTQSQFQLSPSKGSPNRHIFIEDETLLSPMYHSKPENVIVNGKQQQQKDQSPGKHYPVYQSRNIEFDPSNERMNTKTIFGDDLKDQLDNFSMKQINFGKNSQYVPTHYANEHLNGPQGVNLQDYSMYRFNQLTSTQIVARPNIGRFNSPINQNPNYKKQPKLQPSPISITNSKSLASYYGYNKPYREGEKSSEKQKAVRSKSRDGATNGRPNRMNSPQKDTQRMHSSGKEAKNEISSNRLKEIQKIYLQRLH